jgi:hypothetical protein
MQRWSFQSGGADRAAGPTHSITYRTRGPHLSWLISCQGRGPQTDVRWVLQAEVITNMARRSVNRDDTAPRSGLCTGIASLQARCTMNGRVRLPCGCWCDMQGEPTYLQSPPL